MFVVIEHGTRRLAHVNVTTHPSAAWTLQQLREVAGDAERHKYLIHDRDAIFAKHLDNLIRALGVEVLRSPVASPKANAICERVIGTIRRECLDWMLPMSEAHLRSILRDWVTHYNGGRPHSALGPGVPGPPGEAARVSKFESRHQLAGGRDRAGEIGAGRVTSRVSDCSGASGCVVGLGHPSDIQPQWAISP